MADTFDSILSDADDEIIDALGKTATVKDTSDVSVGSVAGVFSKEYVEEGKMQGFFPLFTYKASDLTIATDYEITIDSVAYNVRYPMPDGTGMVTLVLEDKT